MREHEPARPEPDQHESTDRSRRGLVSIVAAVLLLILLIVVVLWWRSEPEPEPVRQPVPERVEPRPQPEPQPEPEPEPVPEPEPQPAPVIETDEPPQLVEPEQPLPELDDSTAPLLAELDQQDINTRPVQSEHLIRDVVIFVHNLSDGEVIRESATVAGPDARFATQVVDEQLYIDERSYQRYDELVDWFVSIDSEVLVNLFVVYQPLFEQAFDEIAHPDETFAEQVIGAVDVLLQTPEPEGLLALQDDRVMYTFADPDLEDLPAAQKQMLRLGLDNQRRVKSKLREIRALLEDRLNG